MSEIRVYEVVNTVVDNYVDALSAGRAMKKKSHEFKQRKSSNSNGGCISIIRRRTTQLWTRSHATFYS